MHFLNFWIIKKPGAKFEFIFWLVSIYLVQPTEEPEISALFTKKHNSEKQIILLSKTKNASKIINLLEWPIINCQNQNVSQTKSFEKRNKSLKKRQMVKKLGNKWANKTIIDLIYGQTLCCLIFFFGFNYAWPATNKFFFFNFNNI